MSKDCGLFCACADEDAYACWVKRYNLVMPTRSVIERDGGPCCCSCHNDEVGEWDEPLSIT